ncbi:hypothetical protein ACFE04_005335 [Oxalis oulophora]
MAEVIAKILTATDVDYRLTFETGSLHYFYFENGVHYIDFKVVDLTDQITREFRLYKRKDGHPKPVISKGWRKYVKQKGLRIGDKVSIRVNDEIDDRTALFDIRAERSDLMAWGQQLWYDI